jgi:signal transduction histidine kinase
MNRAEAIEALRSPDGPTRLRAARFFSLEANGGDQRRIRLALRQEKVPWIIRALERADRLARAKPERDEGLPYVDPPADLIEDLTAKAIRKVSATLVHEFSTRLASLALEAPDEVRDYEHSECKKLIDALKRVLVGVRQLGDSVARPAYEQFDLAQGLSDLCVEVGLQVAIRLAGKRPFLVNTDRSLLFLAIDNAFKNAVEAMAAQADDEQEITVNWGRSSPETWVTVIDNGPGFERDPEALIPMGESTKRAGGGYGLEIMSRAMHGIEGSMFLANSSAGGARVELRWLDQHEDIVS